jgi:hypothetical protein
MSVPTGAATPSTHASPLVDDVQFGLAVVSVNVCGVLPVDDPVVCSSVNVIDCVFGSTTFVRRIDALPDVALGTVIFTEAVRKPLGKVVEVPLPDPLLPEPVFPVPTLLGAIALPPPPHAASAATISSASRCRSFQRKIADCSKS